MKYSLVAGFLLLSVTAALAQQTPPQGATTPSEQAFGIKLLKEIQDGLVCSANLITAQQDLAKAQARIKQLETKPDPAN